MSILGSIFSKVFHHGSAEAKEAPKSDPAAPPPATSTVPTPPTAGDPGPATPPASGAPDMPAAVDAGMKTASPAAPAAPVDVAAMLDGLAAKAGQTLDWKHSIVDMLKLLDLDSSLSARKDLAQELHYSGDTSDSATMNLWLHKQVMRKLADNGGKVPDDLRH